MSCKDLEKMLADLDGEIARSKLFINENGYHNGTYLNAVVRRYRKELKEYRRLVADDLHIDGIKNYKDCEKPNE